MRLITLALGSLLLSACAMNQAALEDTQSIGEQFCRINQSARESMPQSLMMTPALAKTIMDAEQKSALAAFGKPDLKPPLGDGVHYQAYVDYAPLCQPGRAFTVNGVRYLEIHHNIPGQTDFGWADRLVLKRHGDTWQIDDILFAPDYHDSLRKHLRQAF